MPIVNGPNSNFCCSLGMVSEEEYEYAVFKCAFCKTLNPAKKLRPIAPRIASQKPNVSYMANVPAPHTQSTDSESSSSKSTPIRRSSEIGQASNPFETGSESEDDAPASPTAAPIQEATTDKSGDELPPIENLAEKPIEVKKDE